MWRRRQRVKTVLPKIGGLVLHVLGYQKSNAAASGSARDRGGDPVHCGLAFSSAASIDNYTPPVGAAMLVVCQVLCCPIGEYTR